MATKRRAKAVLSSDDIPAGWKRMSDYKREGGTIYERVKKAALAERIASVCHLVNGAMSKSPARWVDPVEVEKFLQKRNRPQAEAPLFAASKPAAPAPQPPAPFQIDGAAALTEALRMLTLEIHEAAAAVVEAIEASRPEREPETFGET